MMQVKLLILTLWTTLMWGGVLQASKYPLIISKARSGIDLRVEITSKVLGEMDVDMRNHFKESLIDKLATFKNPLEAHIDLSRYWLVANAINEGNIAASEAFVTIPDEQEAAKLKEYEPPQSDEWAERFVAMQALFRGAIASSMEISTALQKDESFMAAFAVEDQRGIDLENFLDEQRQAFESEQITFTTNDALQELRTLDAATAEQTQEGIVLMGRLNNDNARTESAFMRTVAALLASRLLEGTDAEWPSMSGNDLPLPAARESTRLRKNIWLATYQHLRLRHN